MFKNWLAEAEEMDIVNVMYGWLHTHTPLAITN